jgi:Ni,Fe-hydrogenase III component G
MFSDDALLIIEGKVEAIDGQEITLIVEDVKDLADARPRNARGMVITLPETDMERKLNEIYTMLSSAQGRCDVVIKMSVENKEVTLQSQILRVEGSARLERELSARGCSVEWSM